MEKLSIAIVDYYIKHAQINKEKREIYIYGFKLIFADVINFAIIMLLGLCINKISESVMFLLTLCGLRRYSGGFHAKTFFVCRLSMIITYIAVITVTAFISNVFGGFYIVAFLNTISVISVSILAPIENVNKKLSSSQKKENKIKSIIASTVLSLFSMTLIVFNVIAEGVTISITLLTVVILMIVGLVVKKGGNSNVQLVE